MNYSWSWSSFGDLSPDGVHTYLQSILIGGGWTVSLAVSSSIFSIFFGSLLGVLRTASDRKLRALGTIYVGVFRNIPLIVQMFLWFFVLPELLPPGIGLWIKRIPQPWGSFVPALLCLSFYGSSRIAEQVRAGIQSVPRGQSQAGAAIGLKGRQVYRYVILPQAIRIVIPLLTSEVIGTVKYSSVASTIGLLELTGETMSMQEYSFHVFEAFTAATLIYLLINLSIVLIMGKLEARFALPGMIGASSRAS